MLVTKDQVLFDKGTKITNDSRLKVSDSYMSIDRVDVEHKGVYVCTTKFGRALTAFVLDVNGLYYFTVYLYHGWRCSIFNC